MKKRISAYFVVAASLFVTGCADLDQTTNSSINSDQFYQSKDDVETAIHRYLQQVLRR